MKSTIVNFIFWRKVNDQIENTWTFKSTCYITVMQSYRWKRKFRKSGDTSSKYLNKESLENKKPKSVPQLLEQSKVSAVRLRIQANMETGSIKVGKDVPKDISKMLTEILEKIAPIETISSNLEKPK